MKVTTFFVSQPDTIFFVICIDAFSCFYLVEILSLTEILGMHHLQVTGQLATSYLSAHSVVASTCIALHAFEAMTLKEKRYDFYDRSEKNMRSSF